MVLGGGLDFTSYDFNNTDGGDLELTGLLLPFLTEYSKPLCWGNIFTVLNKHFFVSVPWCLRNLKFDINTKFTVEYHLLTWVHNNIYTY